MTKSAFAFVCLVGGGALLAAPSRPPPVPHESLNVANGCLVESIYFYDQFREHFGDDAWVRVLQWGAKEEEEVVAGHAVAVFLFQGRLWVWDVNFGYRPLTVPPDAREDVARVSPPILAKYPRITARFPLYRFDFSQAPDAHPATARLLDENSGVRDASVVAAKLARHRPVNLVRYAYVENGVTRVSAAAVFVFHGRFFIYFPETGTVPFLVREKAIANLRLVQEAIRRVHPGAYGLESLGGV